ncbi:MAG: formate dehydrogenase accessory sulfurtransferase FdhD [Candidatus Helarchaeota archaeon]
MHEVNPIKNYHFKVYNNGIWTEKIASICIEKTYNIFINIRKIVSLLCLPNDLKELAVGFLITEGIIKDVDIIKKIEIKGINIIAFTDELKDEDLINLWMETRSSGCVGIQKSWEDLVEPIKSDIKINPEIFFSSQKKLYELGKIWKNTGGTHIAGIFSSQGKLLAFAEDIGRHNAIDKVIGKIYLKKIDPSSCFLITTGRQSVGMVGKVARAKIPMIISNTAPLSQGIDLARKLNIKLICFSREPIFNLY